MTRAEGGRGVVDLRSGSVEGSAGRAALIDVVVVEGGLWLREAEADGVTSGGRPVMDDGSRLRFDGVAVVRGVCGLGGGCIGSCCRCVCTGVCGAAAGVAVVLVRAGFVRVRVAETVGVLELPPPP